MESRWITGAAVQEDFSRDEEKNSVNRKAQEECCRSRMWVSP